MRKRKYCSLSTYQSNDNELTQDIEEYQRTLRLPVAQARTVACQARIHNIVGTAKIYTDSDVFDLRQISSLLPNCTYDKQKFAAITMRLFDPYCTVLLFTSGKMVLTGCRSFAECCWASHNVVKFLQHNLPHNVFRLRDVAIQNIVGNVDLELKHNESIDLDRMYEHESIFCTFQKNMFPGLIYRANNSPVVLLLFQSGKIVITGGKSTRDIYEGWNTLWPHIKTYVVYATQPATST